jgi:hypothetical protein
MKTIAVIAPTEAAFDAWVDKTFDSALIRRHTRHVVLTPDNTMYVRMVQPWQFRGYSVSEIILVRGYWSLPNLHELLQNLRYSMLAEQV